MKTVLRKIDTGKQAIEDKLAQVRLRWKKWEMSIRGARRLEALIVIHIF
jgi:hypothetical protein